MICEHNRKIFYYDFFVFCGQPMLLFWKLVNKTQMSKAQEYTNNFITQKVVGLRRLKSNSKYYYQKPCINFVCYKLLLYRIYTIKATHGKTQWCIKKRYNHFLKLHTAIVFSRKHYNDDPDTNDTQGKNMVH